MTTVGAYSFLERALHRLAFSSGGVQRSLASLEDRLYARELDGVVVERPVFVTGLPRSGTTLLLELLAALPEFAVHTYRCMPFVMCPLIWEMTSRKFRRAPVTHERRHGDGMSIDFDSPEAFEEVFWKTFWPIHYRADRIETWSANERSAEFEDFLSGQIRKLILIKRKEAAGDARKLRYLSKNNANIARLDLLRSMFPDCSVVIPFRHPASHVQSLLRQHSHFSHLHRQDRFALEYMEYLGHMEFGEALRPIDFDGWLKSGKELDANGQEFWWRYWLAAYGRLRQECGGSTVLFDYDYACVAPEHSLISLANVLGLREVSALVEGASRFRAPTNYPDNFERMQNLPVCADALHLHEDLRRASINRPNPR